MVAYWLQGPTKLLPLQLGTIRHETRCRTNRLVRGLYLVMLGGDRSRPTNPRVVGSIEPPITPSDSPSRTGGRPREITNDAGLHFRSTPEGRATEAGEQEGEGERSTPTRRRELKISPTWTEAERENENL